MVLILLCVLAIEAAEEEECLRLPCVGAEERDGVCGSSALLLQRGGDGRQTDGRLDLCGADFTALSEKDDLNVCHLVGLCEFA